MTAGAHGRRRAATSGPASHAIAAMQAALAAEQAASYGYGVVGSHLTGSRFTAAAADCVAHERARDALTAMIAARGGRPRPAAAAYRLPVTVTTNKQAMALAIHAGTAGHRRLSGTGRGFRAFPARVRRAEHAGRRRPGGALE